MLKHSKGLVGLISLSIPWKNHSNEAKKVFLSMMENCEISFKISESTENPEYILIEFLPERKPDIVTHFWEKQAEDQLFMKYLHEFFHPAFLSRFIARAGRLAKNYDHIWKNGIWITHEGTDALIEAFPFRHEIHVQTKGRHSAQLLYLIHKEFKEIYYEHENVGIDVSINGIDYINIQQLKQQRSKGFSTVFSNTGKQVEIHEIAFFDTVLNPKDENRIEAKLKDIVPKPKLSKDLASNEDVSEISSEKLLEWFISKTKEKLTKNIKEVFDEFSKFLDKRSGAQNDIFQLQGRFNQARKDLINGIISIDPYTQYLNQIRYAFILLLDELKIADLDLDKVKQFLEV